MSPALHGSSEIQCFECSDVIKIRNIRFLPGTDAYWNYHIPVAVATATQLGCHCEGESVPWGGVEGALTTSAAAQRSSVFPGVIACPGQ